jgi:hypothetical protein
LFSVFRWLSNLKTTYMIFKNVCIVTFSPKFWPQKPKTYKNITLHQATFSRTNLQS